MTIRLRRLRAAAAIVAVIVAGGMALPSTSARITAQAKGGGATFRYGGDPLGPVVDAARHLAASAVCGAVPDAAVCVRPPEDFVPPWLSPQAPAPDAPEAPSVSPSPAPEPSPSESPEASPSPEPSALPEPGERCESADCVEEAVLVVGAFADELRELQEQEPDGVPDEAVRTIAEFAAGLREMPETPEEDVQLPEETVDALGALVEAGVLEAFTPECVVNVGQLAALLADRQAAAESGDPTPEPSPAATCEPREDAADEASPEPSPEPGPAPQAEPQPAREPEPAPSGEPTEYPSDGPGHRVRSA